MRDFLTSNERLTFNQVVIPHHKKSAKVYIGKREVLHVINENGKTILRGMKDESIIPAEDYHLLENLGLLLEEK